MGQGASITLRIAAAVVDTLIGGAAAAALTFWALGTLFFRGSSALFGIPLVFGSVVPFLYFVLFEFLADGQTPGKMFFRVRVVAVSGRLTWRSVLIRNLVRGVDFLPVFYLLGVAVILMSAKNQRLGDMAAGTVVVALERSSFLEEWLKRRGSKQNGRKRRKRENN